MTRLHRYFFSLTVAQRENLAKKCDTTAGYLEQVVRGYKQPSGDIAIALERETKIKGLCEQLRPKADWAYIRVSGPLIGT